MNWIIWLSCFTQLCFCLPHNLLVEYINSVKGTMYEWPFYAYGLSDTRWDDYNDGKALDPAVMLINYNDGCLGLLVALALLASWISKTRKAEACLILLAVFRDATL